MSEKTLFMDTIDFDEKFAEFMRTVPQDLAPPALADAAFALLKDADDMKPQTPYKTGDLRASRKIEKPVIESDKVSVSAGYDKVYAARLHEGEPTWNWTTDQVPQPGPKFLESKLVAGARKYMEIVAEYIRQKLEIRGA